MDDDVRDLIQFLAEDCGWPIEEDQIEMSAWPLNNRDIGLKEEISFKRIDVYEMRPITNSQHWGVFFISLENGNRDFSVELMRKLLRSLVMKKRASSDSSNQKRWSMEDLIFVCSARNGNKLTTYFTHFEEREQGTPKLLVGSRWESTQSDHEIEAAKEKIRSKLAWPDEGENVRSWRNRLKFAFKTGYREEISTSMSLTKAMAEYAKSIYEAIKEIMSIEIETGPINTLFSSFRKGLINELDEDEFADMIAQTITYGLFSSRISGDSKIEIESIAGSIPDSNPFLGKLFDWLSIYSKEGNDNFSIEDLGVRDLIAMLNDANVPSLVENFGNQFRDGKEDPVIHLYENFLALYDSHTRKDRGVYYTPTPAVRYIVDCAHNQLIKNYGLEDGLADTSTWSEVLHKNPELEIPHQDLHSEVFVKILDPALGTGTFIVEVIRKIHEHLMEKWAGNSKKDKSRMWANYVSNMLLPRIYGFELMMAPFTIAHIKITMALRSTGFILKNENLNILLTNSLEPVRKDAELLPGFIAEHQLKSEIAKKCYFTCVLGNPPYNVSSKNKNEWIASKIEDYKHGLSERNVNSLSDDYIKFIRFCHHLIVRSSAGIVAMITNNSFLGHTIFSSMRSSVLTDFSNISILNLHGDRLTDPKGDENIFKIQKGVCIFTLSRHSKKGTQEVSYASKLGTSSTKLELLNKGCKGQNYTDLVIQSPVLFLPVDWSLKTEYDNGISISEMFNIFATGVNFRKDGLLVKNNFTKGDVETMIADINSLPADELCEKYNFKESKDWKLEDKKILFQNHEESDIRKISYRPFDNRWAYYPLRKISQIIVRGDSRVSSAKHMALMDKNIAILCKRSRIINIDYFAHALVVGGIPDGNFFGDRTYFAPLYLVDDKYGGAPSHNFTKDFLRLISDNFSILCSESITTKDVNETYPKEIFSYVYAIINSNLYTTRYWPQLKLDYPKIQFTNSKKLFDSLASLGDELISIHTREVHPNKVKLSYVKSSVGPKLKISYSGDCVWLDSKKTHGISGIPEDVWGFQIGAHNVCLSWIKSRYNKRKGSLLHEDIDELARIVSTIADTLQKRDLIDNVIESFGGLPLPGSDISSDVNSKDSQTLFRFSGD